MSEEHASAIYSIWHDPTTYDHLKNGPPYLPDAESHKAVGRPKLSSVQLSEVYSGADSIARSMDHSALVQDYGGQPMAWLAALLAMLRGANFIHLTHNWQSKGPTSYQDHLMFERVYNETLELVDQLAERTVGLGDPVLVDPVLQASHQLGFIQGLYSTAPAQMSADACVRLSLSAVGVVLVTLKTVQEKLSEVGRLTPGLEDLLQSMASRHEEFAYLLNQRLRG